MTDGDGETDVYDLSGNGKGVAINIYPDANVGDHGDVIVSPASWTLNPDIITPFGRSFLLSTASADAIALLGAATVTDLVSRIKIVADRTELANLNSNTVGYFDGSLWQFSSSDLSAYVTADPNQAIYVAPASDTTGASGARVRQREGDYLRPEWFGPVGNVAGDDATFTAMQTLFLALCKSAYNNTRVGPTIRLGLKSYYLANSFSWKGGTNRWIGEHAGYEFFASYGTTIRVATDKTFYLDNMNTELGVYTATPTIPYGCDGVVFESIAFVGPGQGVGTANVVEAHVEHYTYNSRFILGGKHGLWINASHSDFTTNYGNANNSRHYNTMFQKNGGSGLAIGSVNGVGNGTDTNIIICKGCNFSYNTEYGVDEGSFLGGQYDGHYAGNGIAPFRSTNANAVCQFSGYIEGPPVSNGVTGSRSWYTGFGSQWVTGPTFGADSGHVALNPGHRTNVTKNSKNLKLTRGAGQASVDTLPYVDEFYYTDFSGGTTPVVNRFRPGRGEFVILGLGYLDSQIKMSFNGNAGIRSTHGRGTAPTGAIGVAGIFIGDETTINGREITTSTAAPASGEHAQGDFRFNQSFTATNNFGWMNAALGTPGTWQALYALVSLTITSGGQTMNTGKLLGRTTASTGAIEELTVGGGLTLTAGVLGVGAITPTSVAVGSGTAITKVAVYTPTLTPTSVGAATVAEQTYTVTGLTTADTVEVNPPAIANATGIVGVRVSAADTLAIRWCNPTAGALTPTSGTYRVIAFRS